MNVLNLIKDVFVYIPIVIALILIIIVLLLKLVNIKTKKKIGDILADSFGGLIIKRQKGITLFLKILTYFCSYIVLFYISIVFPIGSLLLSDYSPLMKYITFIIATLPIAISQLWSISDKRFIRDLFIQYYRYISTVSAIYVVLLILSYIPDLGLIADDNRTILTGGIVTIIAIRRFIDDLIKQKELKKKLKEEEKKALENEKEEKEALKKEIVSKIDSIFDEAFKKAFENLIQTDKSSIESLKLDKQTHNTNNEDITSQE